MTTAKLIKTKIQDGSDRLWTFKDFKDLPTIAVAKTLSRLAKDGLLVRIRKGVYYKPRKTALGDTSPSPLSIIKASSKHRLFVGGTGAFYNARVTTQVPSTSTYITDGPSKTVKIGNQKIRMIHRDLSHLKSATDSDMSILNSLRGINKIPDNSPAQALQIIVANLKSDKDQLDRLITFAKKEPPRVRALLGAIAQHLRHKPDQLKILKRSLNPLTQFKLGLSNVLPTTSAWNIV